MASDQAAQLGGEAEHSLRVGGRRVRGARTGARRGIVIGAFGVGHEDLVVIEKVGVLQPQIPVHVKARSMRPGLDMDGNLWLIAAG